MDSSHLLEFDRNHVWHPYASVPNSIDVYPVDRADGVYIQLKDGRRLIDGMSSWWSAIHGYNHPVLNQGIASQLEKMSHIMFGGLTHEPAVQLGKILVDLTPAPLQKVFFSDSGSVAVEVALKMALQFWNSRGRPEKKRVLTLKGGYHGDTFAAMSVCDPITGMHHLFQGSLTKQLFAERPGIRFNEQWNENDIQSFGDLITQHHNEIAAVILEPIVQGAGGMWFYSPQYLKRARELCSQHDVLLICDEIATGFGRTGKFFACEHADISPDILCVGKALTGGYMSLAATLCSDEVAKTVGVLMHGPTFMANPLACAVAKTSIELLQKNNWHEQVLQIESKLKSGLAPAKSLKGVADVRVLGAIGVIEMDHPVDMKKIQPMFVESGIWLRPFGKLVYTMPPYMTSTNQLDQICQKKIHVLSHYMDDQP